MVATRRGTRADPHEEGEANTAEPTSEEVISSPSQMRTRRSAIISGQTGENGTNESKSAVTSRSPPAIHSTQITTRSRHRSGQSDISEAESTASSTLRRRSCNTQSLDQLPESIRELRSRRIALITERIAESKENAELSDAESNCSSVLITPRRRQSEASRRSVSTRSQSSLLVSEPAFDVTDAESNSTLVSGMRSIATRSTRNSRARHPSSPVRESEKEQTSDAESCSSGITIQPLAKRASRRNKANLQSDEVVLVNDSNTDDYSEKETPKKHGIKSDAQSLVKEQNVLSSFRRSLRSRSATKKVVVISDDEPESSGTINKVLDLEEAKVEESSVTKDADLAVEASVVPAVQSSKTQPEDEEPAMEKSIAANDDAATEEPNQSVQDVQGSASMSGSTNICLLIDSSDSEKSQHCDDEEDESHMQVEEVESVQVVGGLKSKKALTKQIRDASEDGLFVIDKSLGVKSSKKSFLEHEDEDDEVDEKGESSESDKDDDDDEHESNIEVEEEDDSEQVVGKSKKGNKQQMQDVSGDGLFVIDRAAGVDASKKYFLEYDDENDADEKGESLVSDEEEEDGESIIELEDDDDEVQEEGESSGPDNDDDAVEEDNEQVVDKHKSKKATKLQLLDVSGDGLFVIDKAAGLDSSKKYFLEPEDEVDEKEETPELDEDDDDFIDEDEPENEEEALINRPKSGFVLSTSIDTGISLKEMGGLYINFDAGKPNPGPSLLSKMKKESKKKDELLQKSVITPDFEKKESVPPYLESLNQQKKIRKEQRDKTTGRGWFDMKAPELTEELKNDLKALKMRSAMDPKHFYKKNDRQGFPKYFEVGTVVDNPIDYYHSRIPKKERKRTMVDELLADSELRRYNKKKFKEIMAEKAARAEGKKNKKKKKFRT